MSCVPASGRVAASVFGMVVKETDLTSNLSGRASLYQIAGAEISQQQQGVRNCNGVSAGCNVSQRWSGMVLTAET